MNQDISPPIRLNIVDTQSRQVKVSLAMPLSMISVAQRLGARLLPPDVAVDDVIAQMAQGGVTQLAWTLESQHERLEVLLEPVGGTSDETPAL